MDRNQATGLVMIALLFVVYFTFFAPEPPLEGETPAATEAGAELQETDFKEEAALAEPTAVNDSVRQAALSQRYGIFAAGIQGESEEVVLENDEIKVTFDSHGGQIKSVWLKEFLTYSQEPLYLLTEESSQMELIAETSYGPIDLKELYYQPEVKTVELDGIPAQQVNFVLPLGNGRFIRQSYVLPAEGYQLGFNLQAKGLDGVIEDTPLLYRWKNRMRNFEHTVEESRPKSTVNYFTVEEEYEELSRTGENEAEEIELGVKWVGMNHRFFTAAIIANEFFEGGRVAASFSPSDTVFLKHAQVELAIAPAPLQEGAEFKYYFGPNNYQVLNDVTEGFDKNVDLGYFFLRPINKYLIIPTFHFLEQFFTSYGLIIFLLVILIKLLLFPLSYKSYVSMAKTRVLKPQIDEIKEKYGDDMVKIQQEQMKLYSQVGINPISGCVPMLLQMPILFAMFYFFPNAIELRQESFLWAEDLSTYDSIMQLPFEIPFYGDHVSLFTLLMTASTILYTWSNQQMTTVQGPMKTLSYIMPITFLFFLNSYSAGLTYYYFLSNVITFGQQMAIRRFVDDDKIIAKLEQNKLKNKDKKVSGFQARLQEALKASQEAKRADTRPSRKK
ncbi:membrane protein insertase YidC [Nafulsella turpanensis]|uniref:membrane protein insertase YidC n=1 Tax=Nafulsella turpanensis TaxID=1265690 RepID=UPI000378976F|nr:membrane protein insertase YidC [Nafulsella turpanensis]